MNPALGLVVALPAEARALLGRGLWQRLEGRIVRRKRLDNGTRLICVRSGVGIENALFSARWLVTKGVRALAALGVGGGLYPGIKAGDVVIAEAVFENGSGEKDRVWDTDLICRKLAHASLKAEGVPVYLGPVITTRQAVLTVQRKRSLYKQSQALAVDMESGGVARAAKEANLPFFALRAICDPADRSVPRELFDCLCDRGQVRVPFLLWKLLCNPFLLTDLLRIKKRFAIALASLKRGWQVQIKNDLPRILISRCRYRANLTEDYDQ